MNIATACLSKRGNHSVTSDAASLGRRDHAFIFVYLFVITGRQLS